MSSSSLYNEAFSLFLSMTKEKEDFLKHLGDIIIFNDAKSILDIGAGDGSLALPLSRLVSGRYLAVEKDKVYAAKLRNLGLEVREGDFLSMCDSINDKFDLVLASHSLPGMQDKREIFMQKAHALAASRGKLVVVTYDDDDPAWSGMLIQAGLKKYYGRVKLLETFLRSKKELKRVYTKDMITYVSSRSVEDMIKALAFVYSNGNEKEFKSFAESESVHSYISDNFCEKPVMGGGMIVKFPFKHVWLTVRK